MLTDVKQASVKRAAPVGGASRGAKKARPAPASEDDDGDGDGGEVSPCPLIFCSDTALWASIGVPPTTWGFRVQLTMLAQVGMTTTAATVGRAEGGSTWRSGVPSGHPVASTDHNHEKCNRIRF